MTIVLQGGMVIDGRGSEPVRRGDVIIEGERIKGVRESQSWDKALLDDPETHVIDCTGKTVLPGMFNVHEHFDNRHGSGSFQERAAQSIPWLVLRGARNALLDLTEGVTSVRDVGAKGGTNLIMRDAINAGLILGPRVTACGSPIAMTGGHGWQICIEADGPDTVRRAARQLLKEGADFIKLMASGGYVHAGQDQPWSPQFTIEEMRAGFEEARKAGKKTTVHAHPAAAVIQAVEAGVDCIEHGILMDDQARGLLAERQVFLVPTIAELAVIAERGAAFGRPAWMKEIYQKALDRHLENVRACVEAGVRMAVGTDVIGKQVEEMSLMAEAGLNNMDVLVAATKHGAEVCGVLHERGTLEEGKLADIIVVNGDPLVRMADITNVEFVFKGGTLHRPEALRSAIGRVPL
ncbi:MAG: amidohydrolase family protein [Ardenticatenaceae bacterium]|nr:amidohydrolase family protein [Ardenticatenaceae bacterium]